MSAYFVMEEPNQNGEAMAPGHIEGDDMSPQQAAFLVASENAKDIGFREATLYVHKDAGGQVGERVGVLKIEPRLWYAVSAIAAEEQSKEQSGEGA